MINATLVRPHRFLVEMINMTLGRLPRFPVDAPADKRGPHLSFQPGNEGTAPGSHLSFVVMGLTGTETWSEQLGPKTGTEQLESNSKVIEAGTKPKRTKSGNKRFTNRFRLTNRSPCVWHG